MRHLLLVVILAGTVVGCAHAGQNPLVPVAPGGDQERGLPSPHPAAVDRDGPYRLLGEWRFFISAERDRVDVVPRRDPHFHLNALKFLEEYCKDCLQITGIKNNGDSTIDLTVKITHPFKGFPQYTGFDVKGIIMFNGSLEFDTYAINNLPVPDLCLVSWKELGDPEVLNPDGYAFRWSPVYESGSEMPILNYWPGRYSRGLPNAGLNAYLNFYTDEERHMFRTFGEVTRTYKIWLPPGEPVVAGYAVEACWEPPLVSPVTNPVADFPISANQPEPYYFNIILNNGEPIVHGSGCCGADSPDGCDTLRLDVREWDEVKNTHLTWWAPSCPVCITWMYGPCGEEYEGFYASDMGVSGNPPGKQRDLVMCFRGEPSDGTRRDHVFHLMDFTVIEK